jgi:hypothetical protein
MSKINLWKRSVNPNPFSGMAEGKTSQAFGYLTFDCVRDLHTLVSRLLFADSEYGAMRDPRRYTKVCCYEYSGYRPEVWTGQTAENVKLSVDDNRAAITVIDTYGVWSIDSLIETQPGSGANDVLSNSMYVVISQNHIQIRLKTPEGREAWWHVQLEEER